MRPSKQNEYKGLFYDLWEIGINTACHKQFCLPFYTFILNSKSTYAES